MTWIKVEGFDDTGRKREDRKKIRTVPLRDRKRGVTKMEIEGEYNEKE